ncbi:MAG: DUF4476 domain-containing protein [Bacteroidia bacterium]|nr:DUF4476 domain-containing protein [Bacteroidia bacterium]
MKSLLLKVVGFSLAMAQTVDGDLVVVSETGEPFRLFLNGEWITETPVTRAEAHELHEGPQRGIVYIHPHEGRVIQIRKTFYVEGGYVEYYAIRKRKGQYVITQYNRVPRPESPSSFPSPPPSPSSPGNVPSAGTAPSTPSSGGGQVQQNNQNTTIVFNPTIQVQTGGGTQVNSQGSPTPGTAAPPSPSLPPTGSTYTGPCNCLFPMSRGSFQQALLTVQGEPFDQTRLEIAKQIVRQNCLLAQDVRDLARLLDYEMSRLELAKFAYDYTHDLSNYFVVNESFEYSSSKSELMRYIQGRPARQQCQPTQPVSGWAPGGGGPPATGAPSRPCTPCMSASAFLQALSTVRNTPSDAARLEVARQISTTNCLSSEQVRDICRAFASEANRLEFAKAAYLRCCDPQNYFVVNQAFASVLSQEELARYIQGLAGR